MLRLTEFQRCTLDLLINGSIKIPCLLQCFIKGIAHRIQHKATDTRIHNGNASIVKQISPKPLPLKTFPAIGESMLLQLFIGGVMIVLTVLFQALAFDVIITHARRLEVFVKNARRLWKALFLAIAVLCVTFVLIVEIWMWALLYLLIGAFDKLEAALYFSAATFSTVGYGDVVLSPEWRMLSGIEATNGFLLFGWATAFIFEVVSIVYRREARKLET